MGAGSGAFVVDHAVCASKHRLAERRAAPTRPPFVPAGILHRRALPGSLPSFDMFYGRPRPRSSPAATPARPCPPHGLVYHPRGDAGKEDVVDAVVPRAGPPRPQTGIAFFLPL